MLHVVDTELLEVRCHDPARPFGVGLLVGIPLGLLVGREEGAVGLLDGLREVFPEGLLLDDDVRLRDPRVDEGDMLQFYPVLEDDEAEGVLHAEDLLQQLQPECLRMLLLVAPALPAHGERPCRRFLLALLHAAASCAFVLYGGQCL